MTNSKDVEKKKKEAVEAIMKHVNILLTEEKKAWLASQPDPFDF
tara:strand:+ start:122 stop:253 length:132 start_codon:yes stop_codon:yes gene_type:complete